MKTLKVACMVAVVFCLTGVVGVRGQQRGTEKYNSKVLIDGRWGDKPGEYNHRLWEGDIDWPRSFAVDDNEQIYVLDHLNNRVQHYDKSGKLLDVIPLESYKLANKNDIDRWNNGREYPFISARKILFFEGTLYAVQDVRKGNERKQNFLKMQDSSFVMITSTETRSRLEQNMSSAYQNALIKQHLKEHNKFKAIIRTRKLAVASGKFTTKTSEEMFYDGLAIQSAYFDEDGKQWIMSNGLIRKYNSSGEVLFEMSSANSPMVISKQGNLFVMTLYSRKQGDRSQYAIDDYDEGIRINKFVLVK